MTDLDAVQKTSRWLWATATAGAIALHLGGAALVLSHLKTDRPEENLGAPAIEVGLELRSPKQDLSDLPPGPDSDASVASPAIPEQKAEVKETDLPKDLPTETENPDRVVTPNDAKKPIDDAKAAAVQTAASQESVAAEAMAAPSLENVPQGERSVAPAQGTGESLQRVKMTWEKELLAHFDRHKRYPANRVQKSAKVLVSFVLDRRGHVLHASIARGSGDPAFDEAALAMIRRSDPVPRPPPAVADEGLSFTIPVNFRVRGKG